MSELDVMNMPPEDDEGPIEYKLTLDNLSEKQQGHRASQLQYRLESAQHYGQVIYIIGISDDGFAVGLSRDEMTKSIDNMRKIVCMVQDADICSIEETAVDIYANDEEDLKQKFITDPRFHGENGKAGDNVVKKRKINREGEKAGLVVHKRYVSEIIIRKKIGDYWEIKVAVAGNVDCGKSTLLGVLTSGKYDNGRGSARLNVMKHKHETDSGRTSSIGQEIVGFDGTGNSVNHHLSKFGHGTKHDWSDIVKSSSKIVTFFDLPGHLAYFPQAIRGLTSNQLDYAIVTIGANLSSSVDATSGSSKDWINMTKEHLSVVLALGIQCIIVITKIDSTPKEVIDETVSRIDKLIKKKYATYRINDLSDVHNCVRLMEPGNVVPIVRISNVTGEGHPELKKLLVLLPPKREYVNTSPPVLQIQEIFRKVEGTSIVIAGQLTAGELFTPAAGRYCRLKIGPLHNGTFLETRVRSLQCKKMDVSRVSAGRYVCIGLPKNDEINQKMAKGMFAVGAETEPKCAWEFWLYTRLAKNKSSHVKTGYTPHCHIGHIKQTCKVVGIYKWNTKWTGENTIAEHFKDPGMECRETDEETGKVTINDPDFAPIERLSAGDHALLLVRFCFKPELIFDHNRSLMFREQKIKGVGEIIDITDAKYTAMDNQDVTKAHKTRPSRKQRRAQQENARGSD